MQHGLIQQTKMYIFPSWITLIFLLMIFWFCIDHGLMKRCDESPAFCLKRGLWKWKNPEVYTAYTWTEHANLMTCALHMGGKWSSKTEKLNGIQKTKHLLCLVKFTSLYPPPPTCFLTNITWLHSFLCKKKKNVLTFWTIGNGSSYKYEPKCQSCWYFLISRMAPECFR